MTDQQPKPMSRSMTPKTPSVQPFKKGDIIWVVYRKSINWPAKVTAYYPKDKKVSYVFFPLKQKNAVFKTDPAKVQLFTLDDQMPDNAPLDLEDSFEQARRILQGVSEEEIIAENVQKEEETLAQMKPKKKPLTTADALKKATIGTPKGTPRSQQKQPKIVATETKFKQGDPVIVDTPMGMWPGMFISYVKGNPSLVNYSLFPREEHSHEVVQTSGEAIMAFPPEQIEQAIEDGRSSNSEVLLAALQDVQKYMKEIGHAASPHETVGTTSSMQSPTMDTPPPLSAEEAHEMDTSEELGKEKPKKRLKVELTPPRETKSHPRMSLTSRLSNHTGDDVVDNESHPPPVAKSKKRTAASLKQNDSGNNKSLSTLIEAAKMMEGGASSEEHHQDGVSMPNSPAGSSGAAPLVNSNALKTQADTDSAGDMQPFKKGDIIWVVYRKSINWPAKVTAYYPKDKKVSYVFFPLKQKNAVFKTDPAKVQLFTLDDQMPDNAPLDLEDSFEQARRILQGVSEEEIIAENVQKEEETLAQMKPKKKPLTTADALKKVTIGTPKGTPRSQQKQPKIVATETKFKQGDPVIVDTPMGMWPGMFISYVKGNPSLVNYSLFPREEHSHEVVQTSGEAIMAFPPEQIEQAIEDGRSSNSEVLLAALQDVQKYMKEMGHAASPHETVGTTSSMQSPTMDTPPPLSAEEAHEMDTSEELGKGKPKKRLKVELTPPRETKSHPRLSLTSRLSNHTGDDVVDNESHPPPVAKSKKRTAASLKQNDSGNNKSLSTLIEAAKMMEGGASSEEHHQDGVSMPNSPAGSSG
ncbi:hypothetical protein niasHT_011675 [Heterodera trifolii]|uniref:PWWP domain-containing protein n=1 Tax=Heterodera trifolii TaxID=157864 RepID=A0ABD2L2S3_9BILA